MGNELLVYDRLLEIALLLQEDMSRSLASSGLTVARTHLLWELHQRGPSTQRVFAQHLKVSPRNVTGLVDALESGGFVARRPHPTDRRATLVTLTDLGTQTMAAMEQARRLAAHQLVAGFGADQLEQFRRSLDTVAGRLHQLIPSADDNTGE